MIYILNTELPSKKPVFIALTNIFGLGPNKVLQILNFFGISKKTLFKELSVSLRHQIVVYIEKNIDIKEELKQKLVFLKEQQQRLKTYRGLRSRFKLPCRGQRTHTNAKTAKKF